MLYSNVYINILLLFIFINHTLIIKIGGESKCEIKSKKYRLGWYFIILVNYSIQFTFSLLFERLIYYYIIYK